MTETTQPPLICGEAVSLAECPPGLFWSCRAWGVKTEYMTESQSDGQFYPEAYVVESGEYWWGGFSTHPERARQMVHPIAVDLPAATIEMEATHG